MIILKNTKKEEIEGYNAETGESARYIFALNYFIGDIEKMEDI